jgi:hypothetical protein
MLVVDICFNQLQYLTFTCYCSAITLFFIISLTHTLSRLSFSCACACSLSPPLSLSIYIARNKQTQASACVLSEAIYIFGGFQESSWELWNYQEKWTRYVRGSRFPTEIYTRECIESHACSREANMRVIDGISLGSSLSYQLTL